MTTYHLDPNGLVWVLRCKHCQRQTRRKLKSANRPCYHCKQKQLIPLFRYDPQRDDAATVREQQAAQLTRREINRSIAASRARQRREHRVHDVDAWRMQCWNAVDGPANHGYWLETRPTACEWCGSRRLAYNGLGYWCDDCDRETLSESRYVDEGSEFPRLGSPATTFALGTLDRWYEDTTALYRDPASLNWPHGRIRPHCRRWLEGKPRHNAGQTHAGVAGWRE